MPSRAATFAHGERGWVTWTSALPIRQVSPISVASSSTPAAVTFSPNAGWTVAREGTVSFAVTPIVGGVFGNTDGAGVGVEAEVTVGPLELFTEAEYVVDFEDGANNFIYSWSELSVYPTEWLRAGIIGQRLRGTQSGLEVERGLLAGVQRGRVSATVYALNIGTDSRFYLVGLGLEF